MSPDVWGPPIWKLFHTMAAQLTDEKLVDPMMGSIERVCSHLPCPDCSKHAADFWKRSARPKTKKEAIDILHHFHNNVNGRKSKKRYDAKELEVYEKTNLLSAFNDFVSVYHTKGNMNLMIESFHRKLIINDLKRFISGNINNFCRKY